jgi:hypothetical protein
VLTRYGRPVRIPRRYSSLGWTTRVSVTGTLRVVATQTALRLAAPGMNGSGRRLVQIPRRAAAQLIFYPGRFGNAAPTPPPQSSDVASTAHRGERLGPPIATRAEPHNLCTLTAEIDSPPKRGESAIGAKFATPGLRNAHPP